MTALRRRMIEDMTLRNFAPRTIEVYVKRVATFAEYFHTSPKRRSEHIRGYLLHLIEERHVSWSYYNQARCALQVPQPGHPGPSLGRPRCRLSQAAPKAPGRSQP